MYWSKKEEKIIRINKLSDSRVSYSKKEKTIQKPLINTNNKKSKKYTTKHSKSNKQNPLYKETLLGNKLSNYFKGKSQIESEKKLDGSRDYYKYRESGKFGSHSSYDDHGDESFS